MTTNQKLETSREIRQWVGIGLKLGTVALMAYHYIPNFKNWVDCKIADYKARK